MLSLASFDAFVTSAKASGARRLSVDVVNEVFTIEFAESGGQPTEPLLPEKKLPSGTAELAELLGVPEDSNFHFPGSKIPKDE